MMAEDVTDWRSRPTVDGSPWLQAANAIASGDATAFAGALTDAHAG